MGAQIRGGLEGGELCCPERGAQVLTHVSHNAPPFLRPRRLASRPVWPTAPLCEHLGTGVGAGALAHLRITSFLSPTHPLSECLLTSSPGKLHVHLEAGFDADPLTQCLALFTTPFHLTYYCLLKTPLPTSCIRTLGHVLVQMPSRTPSLPLPTSSNPLTTASSTPLP